MELHLPLGVFLLEFRPEGPASHPALVPFVGRRPSGWNPNFIVVQMKEGVSPLALCQKG
jgi:hypothetical protein